MNVPNDYATSAEQWEEQKLGADEKYVKVSSKESDDELQEALNLKLISIRLPEKLLEELKLISMAHGIRYQPMIRDVLERFAHHEINQIVEDVMRRREVEERAAKQKQKIKKAA